MQGANKTINTKVGLDLPMSEQVRQRQVTQRPRNWGGGALGASAPPLFVPGEKVPFFGNESALFS